jgi:hypothetical protein
MRGWRTENAVAWSLLAAIAAAVAAGDARGAVVVRDGFGDADRNNDGTTDGATATDVGDVGGAWWKAKTSSGQTFTVVDDAAGLGSGLALDVAPVSTTGPTAILNFTAVTLNDGDELRASFDARVTTAIPNPGSDRRFRWGLFNTAGAPKTSDGGTSADTINKHFGYIARVDLGTESTTGNTFSVDENSTVAAALLSSTDTLDTTQDPAGAITDTDARSFSLSLKRIGDDLIVTGTHDGLTVSQSLVEAGTTPLTFTYDEFAIGMNGFAAGFRFDNFVLEYLPVTVPEPGAAGLVAATTAAALTRRQRRQ